jgi:hypothetical protein
MPIAYTDEVNARSALLQAIAFDPLVESSNPIIQSAGAGIYEPHKFHKTPCHSSILKHLRAGGSTVDAEVDGGAFWLAKLTN